MTWLNMVTPQHSTTQQAAECNPNMSEFSGTHSMLTTVLWKHIQYGKGHCTWSALVLTNYKPKEFHLLKPLRTRDGLLESGAEHTSLGQKYMLWGGKKSRCFSIGAHCLKAAHLQQSFKESIDNSSKGYDEWIKHRGRGLSEWHLPHSFIYSTNAYQIPP